MLMITDIPSALAALRQYEAGLPAGTPEHIRAGLARAVAALSPVEAIVLAGELLYANLAALDQAGKELCAALIGLASASDWHGLWRSGRGQGIVRAAMREQGSTLPWVNQDPADDPEPLAEHMAPEPESSEPETPDVPLEAPETEQ